MTLNSIIILLFFVMLFIVAFLYRNSTLEKLPLLPGEAILFEEERVRVEQSGSPRSVIFINCIVRVTNRRIIIAQKMLFRRQYALRFVITYNDADRDTDLKGTLMKGYIQMKVDVAEIKLSTEGDSSGIRIAIPETALIRGQHVTYKTGHGRDYELLRG